MTIIQPRTTIPEAWAKNGRCPLCAATAMQVLRQEGCADQLRCASCGLFFEVERDGACLHVTRWPDSFAVRPETVADRWVTAAELRTLTLRSVPPPAVGTAPAPAPGSPAPDQSAKKPRPAIPDEMVVRAQKLAKLGNTPAQIQAILAQSETDPARVKAAIQVASRLDREQQARQRKKTNRALVVIGAIVLFCLVGGFFLQQMVFGTPTAVNAQLQSTLVPNVVKALNLSTPVVQYNVAPPGYPASDTSACPRNAAAAETMFGGSAANWSSPPNTHGWVMIDVSKGSTLYVPKGMTAAYPQLGSDNMTLIEVYGPATLNNVYYIAISCP
jgi:hypothetical protein